MHNMTFKPMTVEGFTVTEEVQRRAVEWMAHILCHDGFFSSRDLTQEMLTWNVPAQVRSGVSRRIIAKAKRAKWVVRNDVFGEWEAGPNAPEPPNG